MRPINTVESPGFVTLMKGLCGINVVLPSRKSITNEINGNFDACKSKLLNLLKHQEFTCTTADIWSSNNKSYLGMTVHFLNDDLSRSSFTLSFKRIQRSHRFNLVGSRLFDVHSDFNIVEKITHEVTDSASYFIKAFKIFKDNDNKSYDSDEGDDDDDANIETPEIEFQEENGTITLPPHLRCCSHTMNLIATSDVEKIIKNTRDHSFKKKYRSTMAKIQAFFNIAHRSTKAADTIFAICDCKFPSPVCTRWNSLYDSIKKLCSKTDVVDKAFEALKLSNLSITD